MKPARIALWVGGIAAGSFLSAVWLGSVVSGPPTDFSALVARGLGGGALPFLWSGIPALVVFAFSRFRVSKIHIALWTWTVALVLVEMVAAIGAGTMAPR